MIKKFTASLFLVLACVGLSRAATTTVTETGAVTVSTSGWHAKGEAIRIMAKPGESINWSYGGTSPKGALRLQWSKDATNWTTFRSTITLAGITTTTGVEQVDDYGTSNPTYFRMYVSSYTSGSWVLSMSDADDLVDSRTNHKNKKTINFNDDSVNVLGNLTVTGTQSVTGVLSTSASTPFAVKIASVTATVPAGTPTEAGLIAFSLTYVQYISTGTGAGAWVKVGGQ